LLLAKYYQDYQIKEEEMDRKTKVWSEKYEGTRSLRTYGRRWAYNIKMYLKEIRWVHGD
jgi:hypothetical protein